MIAGPHGINFPTSHVWSAANALAGAIALPTTADGATIITVSTAHIATALAMAMAFYKEIVGSGLECDCEMDVIGGRLRSEARCSYL
jgi:hypothetical protein